MKWKVAAACALAAAIASCSGKPKPLGISMDQIRDEFNKAIVTYDLSSKVTPIGHFVPDGDPATVAGAKPDTKNKCNVSLSLLEDRKTVNFASAKIETRTRDERNEAIPCVVTTMLSANPNITYADAISIISELVSGVVKTSNGMYDMSSKDYHYSMSLLKVNGLTIMLVSVSRN